MRAQTRRALQAFAVFAFLGGVIALGMLPCPFALWTGHPCPGCGLTRATLRLLHGDFRGAMHLHPLVFLFLPTLALFFGMNTWGYVRTGQWGVVEQRTSDWVTPASILLLALTLGVWVARFFGAFGGAVPVG